MVSFLGFAYPSLLAVVFVAMVAFESIVLFI